MESITDTLIVKLLRIFSYLYSKIKHYSIPLKTKSKMLVNNAKKKHENSISVILVLCVFVPSGVVAPSSSRGRASEKSLPQLSKELQPCQLVWP